MVTLLLAGLGFVAALAWNEAVQAVFQEIFPERGSILAKFIYAIFITLVITVVSLKVSQTTSREAEKNKTPNREG